MSLSVLSVAYPFAPVGRDVAGGAEQVLSTLDRALVGAGCRSLVLAQEGSEAAGTLIPVPALGGDLTEAARAEFRELYRRRIEAILREERVDLVHFHGIDFPDYAPRTHGSRPDGDVPMLATLHLPPGWYPASVFAAPDGPWLNPVSRAQAAACPPSPWLLEPIENGVDVAALQSVRHARRGYAIVLARICPEKGVHLAIDAAQLAGVPLLIAGTLFPYPEHVSYFRNEVSPLLDAHRRYIGPIGFARKRRLLSGARCLLVPSTVDETSSLAAREAIACGAPVIAFRRGALAETVTHGETGFLVDDISGMADAIAAAGQINPEVCRETARRRFSDAAMAARYLALYRSLAGDPRGRGAA